jgi:hypothetical protein
VRRLGFAVVAFLFASCGQAATHTRAAPPPRPNQAASPEWARWGDQARAEKKKENDKRKANGKPLTGNSADFAYKSQPLDITGPGTYKSLFGPLADDFDYMRSPSAISINFPDDQGDYFDISPHAGQVTVVNGKRFLELPLEVSSFRKPYSAFTIWIA